MTAPTADQPRSIKNQSTFSNAEVESVLATAARLLVLRGQIIAASLLANANGNLIHWEHDNWNGGMEKWRLALVVPPDTYFDLQQRNDRENEINDALNVALEAVNEVDSIFVKITPGLVEDPNWREKVNREAAGEGITNQGRVRSDNIATRQYDGLLFRSRPEVLFYNALKTSGVPFAPLPVVLNGGVPKLRRVEPDFVIIKDGMIMIVEIDGDLFHRETPAVAHARLKFLTDESVVLERIEASACDTPDKAREAVARVLGTLQKLRQAR